MAGRIGIIGTGFIAQGIQHVLQAVPEYSIAKVLTRRPIESVQGITSSLTQSPEELIDSSDIIIECSGDPIYASEVIERIQDTDKPVLTMNCELQVTTGSYFAKRGYISDCEGDQPGSLLVLRDEVEAMGFTPLAYLNIKRFLNHNPTEKDMKLWAGKWGCGVEQVTSFTDGTKLQIEQVLVANATGAAIAKEGMLGAEVGSAKDTDLFGDAAVELGRPISDYFLSANAPAGVVIVAKNPYDPNFHKQWGPVRAITTTEGRYSYFIKDYHLCHLEIVKNLRHVSEGKAPLVNNSVSPQYSAGAITKRPLKKGQTIPKAIGSFDVRASALSIDRHPEHVPIGLLDGAVLTENLEANQLIEFSHVTVKPTRALEMYREILDNRKQQDSQKVGE